MSQRTKRIVVAVIALLVAFSLIVPALAHAQLLDSDPADGQTLPMTQSVSLTFNEEVSPDFVTVIVEGPSGEDVTVGEPEVDRGVVTQPIDPTDNGVHELTYRVVSQDGHPVSGQITFTLTDVPAPTPSPTEPTTEPTTVAPEPTGDVAPTDPATTGDHGADHDSDDGGFTWPLGVMATLGILALAVIAGAVAYLTTRRDRD